MKMLKARVIGICFVKEQEQRGQLLGDMSLCNFHVLHCIRVAGVGYAVLESKNFKYGRSVKL